MPRPAKDVLTPKMRLFALEYLVDLNATQAAIRAGYSAKTAGAIGAENLKKPAIAALIQAAQAKREQKLELTADTILRELLRLATVDIGGAFNDAGELLPIKQIPEDVRRALAGVDVEEVWTGRGDEREQTGQVRKVKFWDKPRALELLGKHLKLFTEVGELKLLGDPLAEVPTEVLISFVKKTAG